jgi:hypothetical protein
MWRRWYKVTKEVRSLHYSHLNTKDMVLILTKDNSTTSFLVKNDGSLWIDSSQVLIHAPMMHVDPKMEEMLFKFLLERRIGQMIPILETEKARIEKELMDWYAAQPKNASDYQIAMDGMTTDPMNEKIHKLEGMLATLKWLEGSADPLETLYEKEISSTD